MAPLKSLVWFYFTKNGSADLAQCKLCNTTLKTCGNTTNLRNHLARQHKNVSLVSENSDSEERLNKHVRRISVSPSRLQDIEEERVDDPVGLPVPQSQTLFKPRPRADGDKRKSPNIGKKSVYDYFATDSSSGDSRPSTSFSRPSSAASTLSSHYADSPIEDIQDVGLDSQSANSKRKRQADPTMYSPSTPKHSKQTTISEAVVNMKSYNVGGSKHDTITQALIFMIVKDNLPLCTTDNEGFTTLMKAAVPLYKLPSRRTISRLVDDRYEVLSNILKEKIVKADWLILTTDIWTETMSTKSYLGTTIHFLGPDFNIHSGTLGVTNLDERHTAEYIVSVLQSLCTTWEIDVSRVVSVVTDNGANMVKAIHDFFGKSTHLPCFAHTLNLIPVKASDQTNGLKNLVTKVKDIVTFFKQSVAASDSARKLQLERGVLEGNVLKLKQEVPTRWNSCYYMLERFIRIAQDVSTTLLKFPKSPPMLSAGEIEEVKEMIVLLRPFEQTMKELSGEKYVTSSKVIPLINCLTKQLQKCEPTTGIASILKGNLLREIEKRFSMIEKVHTLAISCLLDPRFKRIHFQSPAALASTIQVVSNMIRDEQRRKATDIIDQEPDDHDLREEDEEESEDIWTFHNTLAKAAAANVENVCSVGGIPIELKQFLNQGIVDINSCPLKYWSTMKMVFPNLYTIAIKYLPVVATSVPSERLFSKAGNVVTQTRNRLTGKRLSKLIFLNSLHANDWNL